MSELNRDTRPSNKILDIHMAAAWDTQDDAVIEAELRLPPDLLAAKLDFLNAQRVLTDVESWFVTESRDDGELVMFDILNDPDYQLALTKLEQAAIKYSDLLKKHNLQY